ncbi:hypothetical protein ABB29_00785 [Pseudoxanthomonas dokdonensis]|uniref:Ergothioneine biosynthesis protein EgtB n=1 Tax=Pseudoxanthomonas dokdonensis TaxID=344882 RepID=A0A0R0CRX7_9GAMM|nr:hypothetical protein ABB29_00785 [Pseudoxanthomonas dokdonensis]
MTALATTPSATNPAPTMPLLAALLRVRARSRELAAPLSAEDAMVQSMADASPAKWHLAHTTWFFERFVLAAEDGYRALHPHWDYLFNSYYQGAGPMHARAQRGLLSRPGLSEVLDYRGEVEQRLAQRLSDGRLAPALQQVLALGLQHEQQHQELLLTDIKHAFFSNPLQPAYRQDLRYASGAATALGWQRHDEALAEIGAHAWPGNDAFAYDNESPRHRVLVPAHALACRPVSNQEYASFIEDGGYRRPQLWMSDGWQLVQEQGWQAPLYWHTQEPLEFTLAGWRPRDPHAPVCHVSGFEADAFARWAGARLPSEAEWEVAAQAQPVAGNFVEGDALHPQACSGLAPVQQLFGDVWEWTSSAYGAYPGFRTLPGTLGEYNGKFMSGQQVLRGGSCVTPGDHVRASYRNFFPPSARWQFTGIRLAKDL